MRGRLAVAVMVTWIATGVLGAAGASAAPVGGGDRCQPTASDGFGPFSRVAPPRRGKIGTGHVLTGVGVSAVTCKPVKGAQVQFWQASRNGGYTAAGSGSVLTDASGRFRIEGPFPPRDEGRPAHIHLRV